MKLCIDGLGISQMAGTGLYTYTYELLDNLFDIYPQPHYEIIWDNSPIIKEWNKYKNISYINIELNRAGEDYRPLEKYMERNKVHIYHSPNNGFSIPGHGVAKYIMTVHELLSFSMEEYADLQYKEKFLRVFPEALMRCDGIIAVSNFVKREIVRHFHKVEEKIHVVYPGCSEKFMPMKPQVYKPVLEKKYNLKGSYILYAGSIHPRKNLPLLLQAFKEILKHHQDLKLVIAGKKDGKRKDYYLRLKAICQEAGISSSVIFTGTVDYRDMPYLYNGALCAVNLSAYEGFPFSTLEAMACGTPVICADSSSFREIACDSSAYIEPLSEKQLYDTILKVIKDDSYRSGLIKKGIEQSHKYSWDSSIRNIVRVYESIAYGN